MRALLMDQPPPSKPQASAPEHILCDTAHGVKSGHQTRSQHPAAPVSAPGLALSGERGPTDMDQGRREHGHEDTSLPVATPMASAAYDLTADIDLSCVPTPVPMPDKPPSSCSMEAFSPELELGKELAGDGLGKMESNLQPPATRQDKRFVWEPPVYATLCGQARVCQWHPLSLSSSAQHSCKSISLLPSFHTRALVDTHVQPPTPITTPDSAGEQGPTGCRLPCTHSYHARRRLCWPPSRTTPSWPCQRDRGRQASPPSSC